MAVRIRMKRMGRTHRPFFRICAIDKRSPRDGRVLEELGTYDPMIADTDARAVLDRERVDYWLGVGAQPSEKVAVLIKKYGTDGTRVAEQEAALEKMAAPKSIPDPGAPASLPKKPEEAKPEEAQPAAGEAAADGESASSTPAAGEAAGETTEETTEKSAEKSAETNTEEAAAEVAAASDEPAAESPDEKPAAEATAE